MRTSFAQRMNAPGERSRSEWVEPWKRQYELFSKSVLLCFLCVTVANAAIAEGLIDEFSGVCLANGAAIDATTNKAVNLGYEIADPGLHQFLGLKSAAEQEVLMKPNPDGPGSIIANVGLTISDGQPTFLCSLMASSDYETLRNFAENFFDGPPEVSFVSDGLRTSSWRTLVNGEWSDTVLNESGDGIVRISVFAPEVRTEN